MVDVNPARTHTNVQNHAHPTVTTPGATLTLDIVPTVVLTAGMVPRIVHKRVLITV